MFKVTKGVLKEWRKLFSSAILMANYKNYETFFYIPQICRSMSFNMTGAVAVEWRIEKYLKKKYATSYLMKAYVTLAF